MNPYGIEFIILELTNRCNLRCEMCYERSAHIGAAKREHFELDLGRLDDVVKYFSNSDVYYLVTGGEPTMHSEFGRFLNIINRCQYTLFTNGAHLNQSMIESIMKTNPRLVNVSILGDEKAHDTIAGVKNSFRKAIRAITLLRKYDKSGTEINLYYTVTKRSVGCIEKLYELSKSLGVNFVFNHLQFLVLPALAWVHV